MLETRVIPTLLLKDRGLYKGESFKKHRYIGDPINTIKIFNDKEVDELIILSIDKKEPDLDYLKKLTKEAFMPMGYGGNINSLDMAKKIFNLGFEKIVINSLFFNNLKEVEAIINTFGSQSVILSVDVKKTLFNKYVAYSSKGRKKEKKSLKDIIALAHKLGLGELLLTSINHEGKMKGMDEDLIKLVIPQMKIPLVIHGGAGSMKDLIRIKNLGVDAIACGSMFVFNGIHKAVLISYKSFYNKGN